MQQLWLDYHTPATVQEAIATLSRYHGRAKIISGGTDLLIDLQSEHHEHPGSAPLPALIDVTRITEMNAITETAGVIHIGAAATHSTIVRSAMLEARATCLVESCGVVGGPQVRNVGTLGGNVAHALPAGDGTTSLMALNAEALVAWGDADGDPPPNPVQEWLPLAALFKGAGVSALHHGRDVLVAFRFQACSEREGCAFQRIMRPQGVALPVLGCAVWIALADDNLTIREARVCLSPVAPVPTRAAEVEAALVNQPASAATLDHVVAVARETLHPRTSKYRATAEYRVGMIETLLRAALPRAISRAQTGIAHAVGVGQ